MTRPKNCGVPLDYFKREVERRTKQGIAFTAYWHPMGIGFLRTDPIPQPATTRYSVRCNGKVVDSFDSEDAAVRAVLRMRRDHSGDSSRNPKGAATSPSGTCGSQLGAAGTSAEGESLRCVDSISVTSRKVQPKDVKVKDSTIKRFKREVERLRRQGRFEVHTAEFDGHNLVTTYEEDV